MSDRYGPKFLVCGSRSWSESLRIFDRIAELPHDAEVIVGDARGADRLAAQQIADRSLSALNPPDPPASPAEGSEAATEVEA